MEGSVMELVLWIATALMCLSFFALSIVEIIKWFY